jgi:hypothetical protein
LSLSQHFIIYHTFAESPNIVRQEIQDGVDDVITVDDCTSSITKLTTSNDTESDAMFSSIDIERVSYFSDGKTLNSSIWLKMPGLDYNFLPHQNYSINFGMLVDVNPNPALGAGGVDYQKEVANYQIHDLPAINTESASLWTENIHETLSSGFHRYLNASEKSYDYLNVFQQQQENARYVLYLPSSLDLDTIAHPDKYKVLFYALTSSHSCNRIFDFTS